jgi:hypothetical protein
MANNTLIRRYTEDIALWRGTGKIDNHLVLLEHPDFPVREDGDPHWPLDLEYFTWLLELTDDVGLFTVCKHFWKVYSDAEKAPRSKHFEEIDEFCQVYADPLKAKLTYGLLYLTMIAEYNKEYAKLGKNIKLYAVHLLFFGRQLPGSINKKIGQTPRQAHLITVCGKFVGKSVDEIMHIMWVNGPDKVNGVSSPWEVREAWGVSIIPGGREWAAAKEEQREL